MSGPLEERCANAEQKVVVVGLGRFELPISSMSRRCPNQLDHKPRLAFECNPFLARGIIEGFGFGYGVRFRCAVTRDLQLVLLLQTDCKPSARRTAADGPARFASRAASTAVTLALLA